ncbi:MAG: MarR family transcriptional regulator [Chloroflexota bacterium]
MIEKYIKASTLLGIVTQLFSTRMNQQLGAHDLNTTQFALLNHLMRNKLRNEGISDLASALEVNQPAVTKIVQKLTKLELLQVTKDPNDSRKKYVSITPAGEQKVQTAMMALGPDVVSWFEGWQPEELDRFIGDLGKLAGWLDSNRL